MTSSTRFQPLQAQPLENSSSLRLACDLLVALMSPKEMTNAELCAKLECNIKTLRSNMSKAAYIARLFGWDIYVRQPVGEERGLRFQLRYTDIFPE